MLGICTMYMTMWTFLQDCAGRARTMSTFLSSGEVINYILIKFFECFRKALMRQILSMPRKLRLRFLRWPPEPVFYDGTSGLALSLFCLNVGGDWLLRGEVSLVHWWGEPGGGGVGLGAILSLEIVITWAGFVRRLLITDVLGYLVSGEGGCILLQVLYFCNLYLEDLKWIMYTSAIQQHHIICQGFRNPSASDHVHCQSFLWCDCWWFPCWQSYYGGLSYYLLFVE